MSNLKVDYEMLGSIVNDMKVCENNIDAIYTDMKTTVESLINNGYMEAMSATAYVTEFNSLLSPEMESLKTLVQKYYTQLNKICDEFADIDYRMSQVIG